LTGEDQGKRPFDGVVLVLDRARECGGLAGRPGGGENVKIGRQHGGAADNREETLADGGGLGFGGAYGDLKLDVKAIEALAKLPSLNELRARIVGMLKTPATRIACVLQAPGGGGARVIAAHATKE